MRRGACDSIFGLSTFAETAEKAFGMMSVLLAIHTPRPREPITAFEAGVCFGSFATIRYFFDRKALDGVCVPTELPLLDVIKVFNAFMQSHPQAQHENYRGHELTLHCDRPFHASNRRPMNLCRGAWT